VLSIAPRPSTIGVLAILLVTTACGFRAGYDAVGLPCSTEADCTDVDAAPVTAPDASADVDAGADAGAEVDAAAPADASTAPMLVGCGSTLLLSDNFDDGSLHAQWRTSVDPGVTAFESEGHVAIRLTSGAGDGGGVVESTSLLDLRGAEASVLVIQLGAVRTSLEFRDYLDNGAAIAVENGALIAQVLARGVRSTAVASVYDADRMHYWRLREAGGTLFWEVSADRATWTTLYSRALPTTSTWGSVSLRAYGAVGFSSESWFDDVTPPTGNVPGFCAASSLQEGFDTTPAARWTAWTGTSCIGQQANGRYELSFTGYGDSWCGLQTRQLVDLRDDAASIEVVSAPGAGNFSTFIEAVSMDGADEIELRRESNGLWFELRQNGVNRVSRNLPYDPVAHRFWRLREAGGVVYWDVSANGATWTTLISAVNTIDVSAVVIDLVAGHWSPGPGWAQTARFDRYSLAP
jgi:hypothetical protein